MQKVQKNKIWNSVEILLLYGAVINNHVMQHDHVTQFAITFNRSTCRKIIYICTAYFELFFQVSKVQKANDELALN
ncbi:hypothetical protein T4D_13593 [Trichinella pseudospiralis]|uniref:Uncharacterized protein n=1 Tax=Trichinella pseudospiralis TaxID=6337 RepID=A0A0V1FYZ1_TRIPS|nr:hypothetical protein T4D_13593 [Trichinella pseudospiralis]